MYKINDKRGKGYDGLIKKDYLATPIYPNLNTSYTSFQQFSYNRNSPQFGNWDRNRSIMNFVSWAYIFSDQNASRMASAKLGIYLPEPECEYTEKGLKVKAYSYKKAIPILNKNLGVNLQKKSKLCGINYIQVIDPSHPINKIISQPNGLQTYYSFMYKIYIFLQLAGQAPVLKLRDDNGIMNGMVVLDPRAIKPVRDMSKNSWEIDHYIYIGSGMSKPIETEDIIWISLDSAASYTETWCPAAAAWTDICLSSEKTNADLSYSQNRMRPDFLIACTNTDQGEMDRLHAQWEDKLKGSSNVGNALLFNSEQIKVEKMQDFDGYVAGDPEALIRKIAATFRYPYSKFISTDSNRASMYVTMREWLSDLYPWMSKVEQALTCGIKKEFPDLDEEAELEFESINVNDEEFDLNKYSELWKTGVIDRYEYKIAMDITASEEDKGIYISNLILEKNKQNIKDLTTENSSGENNGK